MATDRLDDLDGVFDDHPSLSASLEDFEEHPSPRTPLFGMLPSQHSGFRSHGMSEEPDVDEEDVGGFTETASNMTDPWSPPLLGRHLFYQQQKVNHNNQHCSPTNMSGSAWYRQQPFLRNMPDLRPPEVDSPARSRDVSPQYEDAPEKPLSPPQQADEVDDLVLPASIPLPPGTDSPLKGRSPSPMRHPNVKEEDSGGAGSSSSNVGSKAEKEKDGRPDKEPVHESITNCNAINFFFLSVISLLPGESVLTRPRYPFRCARRGAASRAICRVL